MIEGQASDSLLPRVFSFPIGKRAGKTLWSGWISQNGYDFMGLILECLLKNPYSHYLSYETILGLCPIVPLSVGHVTRPSLSLWITLSTFTRVSLGWTLREPYVTVLCFCHDFAILTIRAVIWALILLCGISN